MLYQKSFPLGAQISLLGCYCQQNDALYLTSLSILGLVQYNYIKGRCKDQKCNGDAREEAPKRRQAKES